MIIPNVSICSIGSAKGHSLEVDATLLSQLQSEINRKGHVPVKLNHRGGLDTVIGWIENARLSAGKLIGDLELCKSSPSYNFVRELVSKFSASFGLSPAFSGTGAPTPDGKTAARCNELHSIDLVESPASNPTGLFSARINDRVIEFSVRDGVGFMPRQSSSSSRSAAAAVSRIVAFANALPTVNFARRLQDDGDDLPKASVGAHLTSAAIDGVLGTYVTDSVLRRIREKKWENPFKGTAKAHVRKIGIGAGIGAASAALPAWAVEQYRKRKLARESKMTAGAARFVKEQETRFARLTPEEQRAKSLVRQHKYKGDIREDELNRAASNYSKAGATGALAGGLIGSLRSKVKIGAGIGALAGIGSIKAIRVASPKDEYGQHSPEERAVEKAVPIAAGVIAAIAAKKKLNQAAARAAKGIGRNLARSGRLFD